MAEDASMQAVAATRQHHPSSSNVRARTVIRDIWDGTLVFVDFEDKDGDELESIVHIRGEVVTVYSTWEEFAKTVSGQQRPTAVKLILDVFRTGGVAGLIAIGITITICGLVIRDAGPERVPAQMWTALLTILGFYFGRESKSA